MNEKVATKSVHTKRMTAYQLCSISLITAILCIVGPISIPIGNIPVSFSNLVLLLAAYVLGAKYGTVSCILYLLLGLAGLPVFSGYAGGFAKLAGPTGGYLIGFIFLTYISGLFIEKSSSNIFWSIIGMTVGMIVLYVFGTFWYMYIMNCSVMPALAACVVPFAFIDPIKIVFAAISGREIRKRLIQAHLIQS